MKKYIYSFALLLFCTAVKSQPVFSYGDRSVSKQEFLQAFNKNPNKNGNRQKALNDYLDLYIKYKLKVQAGFDEHLNEEPSFVIELDNFKKQLADNFVNKEAGIEDLMKEAFARSKKDLLLQQVFVPFNKDTAAAYKQISAAYNELKKGKDFTTVCLHYSTDSETIAQKGRIGYVTVFSLPYQVENIVYNIKAGSFSKPYKSAVGFHIFKVVAERPAAGKRTFKQILFSIAPNVSGEQKQKITHLADSVYNALRKGSDFEKNMRLFSDDATAQSSNNIEEISVGQFTPEFENPVFELHTKGTISKPFATAYGIHIVQLVDAIPVPAKYEDALASYDLKQKVESSDRLLVRKKLLTDTWKKISSYQQAPFNKEIVFKYVDSVLHDHSTHSIQSVNDYTVLFSFPQQHINVADFLQYLRNANLLERLREDQYEALFRSFTGKTVAAYYKNHLEDFDPVFKNQIKEFEEANILFTATDKHVWTKAVTDSTGLKNYYTQHSEKYQWKPGYSAIVVYAATKDIAQKVALQLQQQPQLWKSITSSYGESVIADSNRFEKNISTPLKGKIEIKKGFISAIEASNVNDKPFVFALVTGVFEKTEQKSFEEAKPSVTADYQQVLEENWITQLQKKYPVVINKEVWKTVH